MDERIERAGDEQAIRDVLARYWRGIDRCDAELVREAYHPDAYDDHGYYKGPVDGFIESLPTQVWPSFVATQHFSGHIAVELDGADVARAESYAEAHHIARPADGPARDLVYGLRYVDRFERRDGLWKIAHRVCTWDWHRIDEPVGSDLPDSYFRGPRDRSDPVHDFPARDGRRVSPEDLAAKQACYDVLMRYARGVDRCDPDLIRSAYHPDAYDDHGGYQGDVDGFIAWVKPTVLDAFTCTMHKLGNVLIEVDGDRAYSEAYAVAHHVRGQDAEPTDWIMGVRYLDRLERRSGEWRIAHRRMSFEWERSTPITSQAFGADHAVGARDGSDPVLRPPSAPIDTAELAADRAAIYAQLVRYTRAVDRGVDEELLRSVYHPDALDDHGAYSGDVDGFIDFLKRELASTVRISMHKLGQCLIELDGDAAHAESYAIAHHVFPLKSGEDGDHLQGLRYVDRFERRNGEWRIAHRQVRYEWQRLDRLTPLDPTWTLGRFDRSDPVFVA